YLANPAAPEHSAAIGAAIRILEDESRLTIAPSDPCQPTAWEWTVAQTRLALDYFHSRFSVLEETALDLAVTHELKGKRIHDAHLLATMQTNGVTHLLTFNAADLPTD